MQRTTTRRPHALAWMLALVCGFASAQIPSLTLDSLPRPSIPSPEVGPIVPSQVLRWRQEAMAFEYGDGVPRDLLRAAELYCRAARYGDPEAQYNLAWMLTHSRGIERDDAQAAHLFAAAAEQGITQAQNMLAAMGTPQGPTPDCLRQPDSDPPPLAKARPSAATRKPPSAAPPTQPPLPPNAPEQIVKFVTLVAPEYQLSPHLVLAVMAMESNFDPWAVSPKNAQGLMQLIPDTAARFKVKRIADPAQNIRGGMAYLRWLLAYFQGDLTLVLAAYNAGEGAVDRYGGVPPYAETRSYVRRIILAMGGQRAHSFDSTVTSPSELVLHLRHGVGIR